MATLVCKNNLCKFHGGSGFCTKQIVNFNYAGCCLEFFDNNGNQRNIPLYITQPMQEAQNDETEVFQGANDDFDSKSFNEKNEAEDNKTNDDSTVGGNV